MKRTALIFLLTSVAAAPGARLRAQARPATDVAISDIVPITAGGAGRLCAGAANAVRVALTWQGAPPERAVSLRLELVLPGGTGGTLLAEGSVILHSGSTPTTFTFLRVDVPRRLQGRNARLVARANADQAIPEEDYSNDVRQLPLDAATDWSCATQ